eukprot:TRINITY_DN4239_c0_g1_i1.p1 TRINITY_DN4239_c0_g1~~TRINITY_DN4239_c0_g1_i1.p1  ORF type:complete len:415 (+),score=125.70 TRINITY_DN4239_c0_g1_i1:85-1329(+)
MTVALKSLADGEETTVPADDVEQFGTVGAYLAARLYGTYGPGVYLLKDGQTKVPPHARLEDLAGHCVAIIPRRLRGRVVCADKARSEFRAWLPEAVVDGLRGKQQIRPDHTASISIAAGQRSEVRSVAGDVVRLDACIPYDWVVAESMKLGFNEEGVAVLPGPVPHKVVLCSGPPQAHSVVPARRGAHAYGEPEGEEGRPASTSPRPIPLGFTVHFTRFVEGAAGCVDAHIAAGKSVLFIGRPGAGKTTALRSVLQHVTREGSGWAVDVQGELCGRAGYTGGCCVATDFLPNARRLVVESAAGKPAALQAIVAHHAPGRVVMDNVGTGDVGAVLDAASAGVPLAMALRGVGLAAVLRAGGCRPLFEDGGVAAPVFDVVVEMDSPYTWYVVEDVRAAVALAREGKPYEELRRLAP